ATADKVRTGLLAAVGHDLRSPLAAIKAAVSSLRADDVQWEPDEQAELLAAIEDGADRLSALVANLLDLSRLQAGSMPVLVQTVGVDEVVARALLHQPDVDVVLRDDLPLVLADPGLLERVVANLVDNARRYTTSGRVQVAAAAGPTAVRLTVTDHGPGVPPQEWERMFVPFQRLDDRSTTTGLGLGLAIAAGFTEAMGATLTPSTTPGGGLTMTVELRRALAPEPLPGARPTAGRASEDRS
ncbi:sensor histidine kinase, partial [Cellulomonas citrea]|uniref:sensor histidine kinase n=1 Tax=Cellulomonas citrea TaxID=1909423 RepID=UPI001F1B6306